MMLMYSWNMLKKCLFYCCYAFVNALFPCPHPILTRWWPFFLVSLFRLKKSSFFWWKSFFFWGGGGSAENVSAPYEKPKALSAPSPTWIIVATATAFPAPGKRLVMWVLKIFNLSSRFILHYWKCFITLPFFSFLHRFLLSLPCTPS